jgi:hypothetical protein
LFVVVACGGGGSNPNLDAGLDAGEAPPIDAAMVVGRRMMVATVSDERGVVRLGSGATAGEIVLIDARTQRVVGGAKVDAVEEGGGYFARVAREEDAFESDLVFVGKGQRVTVPMEPATPAVRGKMLRPALRVFDEDYVAEGDLGTLAQIAEIEQRPNILFVPPISDSDDPGALTLHIYRPPVPGALLAVQGMRPTDGQLIDGVGRVVATAGVRRAGVAVTGPRLVVAARAKAAEQREAPTVATIAALPGAQGTVNVTWTARDPAMRLLAFDVGLDTTRPDRRVNKDVASLTLPVTRGAHFACVRALFEGAEVDPQLACVAFVATDAPAVPNLRVSIKTIPQPNTVRARSAFTIEVEVENDGDADAGPFEIAVVVSQDAREEGGLGETRVVQVDGVKAKSKTSRTVALKAPRDGAFFVVAKADPTSKLLEGNTRDNIGKRPIAVMPEGQNRAPVLSLGVPEEGGAVLQGSPVMLRALAVDPEDGDLSARITWTSSIDGPIGIGATVAAAMLSPGVHKIRAEISDQPAARRSGGRATKMSARDKLGFPAPPAPRPLLQASEPTIAAELTIEVLPPAAPINSPPRVTAGPDLTTTVGTSAQPVAAAMDPDGDPLTIAWTATGPGGNVALANPNALAVTLAPDVAGVYRLRLTVSDGKVLARDEMVVTVLAPSANAPPTVTVALPPAVLVGARVNALVTAGDPDGDGVTLSFGLARPPASGALLEGAATTSPAFVPDVAGGYALTVTADDGRGGRASAVANVMVSGRVATPDAGVDAPPLGVRELCTMDAECASGHCEQGVCCSGLCEGLCRSCNLPGSVGACTDVAAGAPDPSGRCMDQGATSCGNDGLCAGDGSCRKYAPGVPCGAGGCTAGIATAVSICDGGGLCMSAAPASCAPYTCNAQATACLSACVTNAQCAAGFSCEGGGACKKSLGAACATGVECVSNHCVDGVCCSSACAGPCQACDVGPPGMCTSTAAGVPDPMCPVEPASGCQRDGTCDGAGACRLHNGTQCIAPSCLGATRTTEGLCNGMGSCLGSGVSLCTPYACMGVMCAMSCTGDGQCSPPNVCEGSVCTTLPPGLVLRMGFDEGLANNVADLSGNANHGVIVEGTTDTAPPAADPGWAPGRLSPGSLLWSGGQRHIRVAASPSLNEIGAGPTFTIMAWVRIADILLERRFLVSRQEMGLPGEHYGLYVANGKPGITVYGYAVEAFGPLSIGTWTHVAAIYDGVTSRLYVNGVQVGFVDIGMPLRADSTPLLIGARQVDAMVGEFWGGYIDDLRIYKTALLPAQIMTAASF